MDHNTVETRSTLQNLKYRIEFLSVIRSILYPKRASGMLNNSTAELVAALTTEIK